MISFRFITYVQETNYYYIHYTIAFKSDEVNLPHKKQCSTRPEIHIIIIYIIKAYKLERFYVDDQTK